MNENYAEPTGEEEAAEQQQALVKADVRHAVQALDPKDKPQPKTSQEMRVVEVSEALLPAYQRASTLDLTPEEIEKVMAAFPDSVVEVRPHDGLLYIPHIHISDRLNRIFGPGKWALIRRREWFDESSSTMFGEYVLVIRGCYVGESVGGHPYVKSNPKVNFSDVLESTAAEALRRIAGKRLSMGSQVWNPEYCRDWEAKYRGQSGGKWFKKKAAPPQQSQATSAPAKTQPAAKPATQATAPATEDQRAKLIQRIPDGAREYAREFFERCGAILPNEGLEDLPLDYVPATQGQFEALMKAVDAFAAGEEARLPYPRHEATPEPVKGKPAVINVGPGHVTPAEEEEAWRSFEMPWGNDQGTPLGELDKKKLFGWWANFTVETEYQGRPKKPETIAKDEAFREALDAAGEHYQFTKKD